VRILVTNDDGIHAEGIKALAEALKALADVVVVAPDREQNAVSHALTLHRPLRAKSIAPGWTAVNGTPTDCVHLAVNGLLSERPALIASGINCGHNLGEDITYSGTVAAAIEGTLMGIPSFAISVDARATADFGPAASFALRLGRGIVEHGLPRGTLLNVNLPYAEGREITSFMVTRQGKRVSNESIVEKEDPRGQTYYWIGGNTKDFEETEDSDIAAVGRNLISVTPLKVDLTDDSFMTELKRWAL
jgi:5'-nucleotidase